jgi:hypothetical protein
MSLGALKSVTPSPAPLTALFLAPVQWKAVRLPSITERIPIAPLCHPVFLGFSRIAAQQQLCFPADRRPHIS